MGIVLKTNINALMKKCEGNVAKVAEQRAIAKLQYLGEKFLEAYRLHGSYKDRTGNLRSSGGYVVVANGHIVLDGIEGSSKGADGTKEVKKLAKVLSGKYNNGYVLICMAGMDYAAHLQLMDFDVIDTAEHVVRTSWDKIMKKK